MGVFLRVISVFILVFAVFQFIPYEKKTNPPINKNLQIKVSKNLSVILKNSCYDCHSNETKWPWWSHIAPASWSIIDDVIQGRDALNFSIWNSYSKTKIAKLKKEIYRTVAGPMPLPQYVLLHKNAKLSKKEMGVIRNWASNGKGFMRTTVR